MNGDVCGDFPLQEMYDFYNEIGRPLIIVAATEATRNQSLNYGIPFDIMIIILMSKRCEVLNISI